MQTQSAQKAQELNDIEHYAVERSETTNLSEQLHQLMAKEAVDIELHVRSFAKKRYLIFLVRIKEVLQAHVVSLRQKWEIPVTLTPTEHQSEAM